MLYNVVILTFTCESEEEMAISFVFDSVEATSYHKYQELFPYYILFVHLKEDILVNFC